jgi:CheY-like chemotaxis protein
MISNPSLCEYLSKLTGCKKINILIISDSENSDISILTQMETFGHKIDICSKAINIETQLSHSTYNHVIVNLNLESETLDTLVKIRNWEASKMAFKQNFCLMFGEKIDYFYKAPTISREIFVVVLSEKSFYSELLDTNIVMNDSNFGSQHIFNSNNSLNSNFSSNKPSKHINILVVDNSTVIRKLFDKYLSAHGYSVDTVLHGLEAIQKLKKQHYDVIIMDLNMPQMNGIDTTKHIRENENNKHKFIQNYLDVFGSENLNREKDSSIYMNQPVYILGISSDVSNSNVAKSAGMNNLVLKNSAFKNILEHIEKIYS